MKDVRREALRVRLQRLTPDQRAALSSRVARAGGAPSALVGFVVPRAGADLDDLGSFLRTRLPEHMVPARFLVVERLPRTPTGKLDRKALPALTARAAVAPAGPKGVVPPRTEAERTLARIWSEVLGVEELSVHDDFFEIGGDSLLSIRVLARAGREGLRLDPEAFFERPTIAHLAALLETPAAADPPTLPPASPTEPLFVGLTPIQAWFFERIDEGRDWWNQCQLVELPRGLALSQVEAIIGTLVAHHPALRLRFHCEPDGRWSQVFAPVSAQVPLRVCAIGSTEEPAPVLAAALLEEQTRMRLVEGPLFRAVLTHGPGRPPQLALLAHHLLVDGVSWTVLLEDLSRLVEQTEAGAVLGLEAATLSPSELPARLQARSRSSEVRDSIAHWLSQPEGDHLAVPVDPAHPGGRDRAAHTRRQRVVCPADLSKSLLQEQPRRLDVTVQELLLAAVWLAWRNWSGRATLLLDLEGHGRGLFEGAGVARTVAWMTTVFPVWLRAEGSSPQEAVRAVCAGLRYAPPGGFHGLLRLYGEEAVRSELRRRQRSQVLFNYLGSTDTWLPPAAPVRALPTPEVAFRSPAAPRAYPIEVNAYVRQGQLTLDVETSAQFHDDRAAEGLTAALRAALTQIADAEPDPLAWTGLGEEDLSRIGDLLAEIDDE